MNSGPGPCPDPMSKEIEYNRNWYEGDCKESQCTSRPRHAEIMVHFRRKEGKAGREETSNDCVGGYSTVRIPDIHVNYIFNTLDEDGEHCSSNGDTCEDLWSPHDVRVAGPRKTEEPKGEYQGPQDHRRQALFRNQIPLRYGNLFG